GIRRRLAPLMGNDRRRIELLNALLFSLPGTPVLYYGDEIGLGENIFLGDRNGVRTPMHWSSDKNAGFSRANPQSLYLPIILDPQGHYEAVNVEAQLANPHSLLWWMRRLLALRKRWRALGEGKCEFLRTRNRKILSYVLRYEQETVLVVANLSRFVQPVELDLSAFDQMVPVELFGRMKFPPISHRPYFLTLGPHAFYWFSLESSSDRAKRSLVPGEPMQFATVSLKERCIELFSGKAKETFESLLPDYLKAQSWFAGQNKEVRLVSIRELFPVPLGREEAYFVILQVDYLEGESESYALPLAFASDSEALRLSRQLPHLVLAEVVLAATGQRKLVYDAMVSQDFCRTLLDVIHSRRALKGDYGTSKATRSPELRTLLERNGISSVVLTKGEYSSSSAILADQLVLKVFRRIEPGWNPELEIGGFLESKGFSHSSRLIGSLEYVTKSGDIMSLATLTKFIPQSISAWNYTLDALGRYFDRAITWVAQGRSAPLTRASAIQLLHHTIPEDVAESIGSYIESARLLGVRTAELHLALVSGAETADFAAEPFTPHYQRGLLQSMRNQVTQTLRDLRQSLPSLPAEVQLLAKRVTEAEPLLLQCYRTTFKKPLTAKRIRIHGDCHLGQILWTGKDFVFIDFEGDPRTALSERRIKRSPLRDVAGLLCSFQFAAQAGLVQHFERGSIAADNLAKFEKWVRFWATWVSVTFLRAYFHSLGKAEILPASEGELRSLLRAYFLHQMVSELGRQLTRRPGWIRASLETILRILEEETPPSAPPLPTGATTASPPAKDGSATLHTI
ncbi:MAG TPA: alpha-glucosidase C-terminal domain-containing protein, partial [Clostridia bacterium]|nr:alpha-glucosidase C-terminal domain-containing protein [Clostridia bacterium]